MAGIAVVIVRPRGESEVHALSKLFQSCLGDGTSAHGMPQHGVGGFAFQGVSVFAENLYKGREFRGERLPVQTSPTLAVGDMVRYQESFVF